MIKIISGSFGAGLKNSRSGAFTLPDEEEKRLVDRGVAAYVNEGALLAEPGALDAPPEYSVDTNANTLRELLKGAGLKAAVGMSKQEMVNALDAFYMPDGDEDGDEDDEDGGGAKMPELDGDGIVT